MLIAIGFVALTALVMVLLGGTAGFPGNVQHIFGQSTETTATITKIDKVGFCTRSNRDQYTLTWHEDGVTRTETIGRCGDPWELGDQVPIWSTADEPYTESPWVLRSALLLLTLGIGVTTWIALRRRSDIRRSAHRALNGTWQPQVVSTVGIPGTRDFEIHAPQRIRNRPADWMRVLYKPDGDARPPRDVSGMLFIDGFTGDRPSGLSLHETADGRRVWRWHGRTHRRS